MSDLNPETVRTALEKLEREVKELSKILENKKKMLQGLRLVLASFAEEESLGSPDNAQCEELQKRAKKIGGHADHPTRPMPTFQNVRPHTRRILEAVWHILARRGEPMRTRDIVTELEGQGIDLPGKDKVAALSAALSHSPYFRTRGRALGWELVETGQWDQENP